MKLRDLFGLCPAETVDTRRESAGERHRCRWPRFHWVLPTLWRGRQPTGYGPWWVAEHSARYGWSELVWPRRR